MFNSLLKSRLQISNLFLHWVIVTTGMRFFLSSRLVHGELSGKWKCEFNSLSLKKRGGCVFKWRNKDIWILKHRKVQEALKPCGQAPKTRREINFQKHLSLQCFVLSGIHIPLAVNHISETPGSPWSILLYWIQGLWTPFTDAGKVTQSGVHVFENRTRILALK